ncbi:MAG TPA: TPM domain-containing protein, partial [Bacillota bacterium]|nr:TPM domain-containing protein [Bacillota bacterium]
MRRISILLLVILGVFLCLSPMAGATEYPAPTQAFYVNDYANVISGDVRSHIESATAELEARTGAQIVVVTLSSLEDASLEDFSLGLFREWGIGSAQDNNGVLILVDVGGRQSRIEVGYGLEGALPDGRTGRIQDQYMVPDFAVGDYSLGIKKGFDAIITQVYGEYGYEFEGSEYYPDSGAEDEPGPVPILGIIIVIILIVLD